MSLNKVHISLPTLLIFVEHTHNYHILYIGNKLHQEALYVSIFHYYYYYRNERASITEHTFIYIYIFQNKYNIFRVSAF